MKLLVITQTVDKKDSTLGFFHAWIEEFARRCEHIDVITLGQGSYQLPQHVRVFSLGKEKRKSRLVYVFNFYRYIWKEKGNYDAVFVHMNQEYVLLGGVFWKLMGKKIFFWRNHSYGNILTRSAVALSDEVFCTSADSYTARFAKTVIMPAGIDVKLFEKHLGVERSKQSLLMFGRIAPVKKIETAIDTLAILHSRKPACVLNIVGDALPRDEGYLQTLRDRADMLGIGSMVHFEKGVPFEEAPRIYQSHEIFLNMTSSGSFDKTVIEALASGCKVMITNTSMQNILPHGSYSEDKPKHIAEGIERLLAFDDGEAKAYGEEAKRAVASQSLSASWIDYSRAYLMYKSKKVSVVIPTYNEAETIRKVIEDFFATGVVDEVVVVDNNARGNTADEIRKTKARHIIEKDRQGYGHAIMRGLAEATGDLIAMVEADSTFQAKDIEKLLAYSDEFDAVLGTRTSRAAIYSGAFMPFPVRFGNWLWAKMIEIFFNGPVLTDVGCTFKLISRNALNKITPLFPLSDGDGRFSPELMIWLLRKDVKTIEVPVIFRERVGQSMYTGSVWRAAHLGARMIPVIIKYRFIQI